MKIRLTQTESNKQLKERIKVNLLQGKEIDAKNMLENLNKNKDITNPYKNLKESDIDTLMDELITEGIAEKIVK